MKISVASAMSLTDLSENTFRRRIANGIITRTSEEGANGRSMIPFEAIRSECHFAINDDDLNLIGSADRGNAEAQNDLALLFLSHNRPKNAIYWLELAAKQKNSDAMHWLGRCYIEGRGTAQDENIGLMWLARAASQGHYISHTMMREIREKLVQPSIFPRNG